MSHSDIDIVGSLNPNNNVTGGLDRTDVNSDEDTDLVVAIFDKRTDAVPAASGADYGLSISNVGNLAVDFHMFSWYISTDSADPGFRCYMEMGERVNDGGTPTSLADFFHMAQSTTGSSGNRKTKHVTLPAPWRLDPDETWHLYATYGNLSSAADDVRAQHMFHGTAVTDSSL